MSSKKHRNVCTIEQRYMKCALEQWKRLHYLVYTHLTETNLYNILYYIFLALDFCRFCVVFCFFIPATTAKTSELLVPFFITSLIWHGPWLGIESWTSRTRCQHSTTRLSRRRYILINVLVCTCNHPVLSEYIPLLGLSSCRQVIYTDYKSNA